jgi:amino acid transporter
MYATIYPHPGTWAIKRGKVMEFGLVAGAALIAVLGAYVVTLGIDQVDDIAKQVKKSEKSRAKMKKALEK